MKRTTTLITLLAFVSFFSLHAQETVTVSVGASYINQVYYSIDNDDKVTLNNESWDLAFSTGPTDGGIFINEAVKSVISGTVPDLKLYLAPTTDFSDLIIPGNLSDSLYNEEEDWQNGAFNGFKDDLDPSDYGWGFYDSGENEVIGIRVFALKLRDGSWKKIKVESLTGGVYTMRYADLDGANESLVAIDKADYSGSPLAYFSFGTGTTVASPAGWDFLFTRYVAAIDPGGGNITQYPVTGVLSGPGVEVAEAQYVDPATVDYQDYLDSFDTHLDVIGQDWKYFDLNNFQWVIDDQRAFFAKMPNNDLWKLVFTGFSGSGTGTFTFEKTYLGQVSGVEDAQGNFTDIGVFPNPVAEELNIAFSLAESRERIPLSIFNQLGQEVLQTTVSGNAGMNVITLPASQLPGGVYFVRMGEGRDVISLIFSAL